MCHSDALATGVPDPSFVTAVRLAVYQPSTLWGDQELRRSDAFSCTKTQVPGGASGVQL